MNTILQRLITAVSPSRGRILVYVWAIEQDEQSKRTIPQVADQFNGGEDVFVPWVLSKNVQGKQNQKRNGKPDTAPQDTNVQEDGSTTDRADAPRIYNRYYHMFARGELAELVEGAASMLGLHVGPLSPEAPLGIEIVQDGWERSNYYVELRRWKSS